MGSGFRKCPQVGFKPKTPWALGPVQVNDLCVLLAQCRPVQVNDVCVVLAQGRPVQVNDVTSGNHVLGSNPFFPSSSDSSGWVGAKGRCWALVYKPPLPKRGRDLQWRVAH